MTNEPQRDTLDELRHANPVSADEIRGEAAGPKVARQRAIARGDSGARGIADGTPRHRTRARLAGGFAVAAGCTVVGLLALGGDDPVGDGSGQAFAGEAIEVAEANPRILVNATGWSVGRVNEFDDDSGSMEFTAEGMGLSLDWRKVPEEWDVTPEDLLSDLPSTGQWYALDSSTCIAGSSPAECVVYLRDEEIEVAGQSAILSEMRTVTEDQPSSRFEIRLAGPGETSVDIYADSMSRTEVEDLIPSLVKVDVDTWLSALPERTVKPLERPEVVDEMLADVPVPDSVDVEELKEDAIASGRYYVGTAVTGAVACGWLDQWAAAFEAGDDARVDEATEALATSPDWDILVELDQEGGWSRVIWEYAREMRGDEPRNDLLDSGGTESLNGTTYALAPSYAMGLGCDSLERRLVTPTPNYAQPNEFKPIDQPPA